MLSDRVVKRRPSEASRSELLRALGSALCLGLGGMVVLLGAGPAVAAVSIAINPPTQTVTPGTDFDVFVDVTNAGSAFNGFDIVVSFDPAALTPVPLVPLSSQQGCLMTGACSAACGNTFHLFNTAGDSVSVNNVLLCNQTSLTGPGRIYRLRFHASSTQQVTQINLRRASFFNAGLFVTPVNTAGCQVGIGVAVGVTPSAPGVARPLRVEPNPASSRVNFVSDDDTAGLAELRILDLQGRVVRQIGPLWLAPRARLAWDRRDAQGAVLPAGIYLVHVRRGDQVQNTRVVLLP